MEESKRAGKKVTQVGLAQAANVSQPSMWAIVNGETKAPNPDILRAIADVFTHALGRRITIDNLIEKEPAGSSEHYPVTQAKPLMLKEDIELHPEDFTALPELGSIPHGDLDQVREKDIVARHWLPKSWVGEGQFILRAKGDAMAPDIKDGDLLLIEPGDRWDNQDIVVAYVEGEITCKYLHLYDGYAMLVPANPTYQPTVVTDEMRIVGRVIRSLKAFV